MAKIWTEVEIEFEGATYRLRPTLAFINHLEQSPGCSIANLFARMSRGDLPGGLGCEVIAKALDWAGAEDITAEDVFEATGGVGVPFSLSVQSILLACMPNPKGMSEDAKKKPVKRKPRKKSTGTNSTGSRSTT